MHAGGYQTGGDDRFTYGGEKSPYMNYIVSGVTPYGASQSMLISEFGGLNMWPKTQGSFYDPSIAPLTKYDRQTAHEIIHSLGVGTHDCGFSHSGQSNYLVDIENTLETANFYSTFGYGDSFSVLGNSAYALGVSPVTAEFLGWLTPLTTHRITESETQIKLQDFYSDEGKVMAKIKLSGGWLYASYHSGKNYDASLNDTWLIDNTKGLLLRFSNDRDPDGYRPLTTSMLLDANNDLNDFRFALLPGEHFELFDVVLENVQLLGGEISFDVRYVD